MDIKLPPDPSHRQAETKTALIPSDLKPNQLLNAEIISDKSAFNTLVLRVGGRTMEVEAPPSAVLPEGPSLQLRVVKLQPVTEFKVLVANDRNVEHQTSDAPTLKLVSPRSQPIEDAQSNDMPRLHDTPPQPILSLSSAIACLDAEAEQRLIRVLRLIVQRIQGLSNNAQPPIKDAPAMDIKLPLDASLQPAMAQVALKPLNLKPDQLLSAKVVDTQIMLDTLAGGEPGKQILALSVAGRQVLVQAQPPVNLQPGQSLQLQVVKLLPAPEFRIAASPQTANPPATQMLDAPILKLLNLQPPLSAAAEAKPSLAQLAAGQQLQATVVEMSGNKLTLQLSLSPPAADGVRGAQANPASPPVDARVTLDAKQLVFTAFQSASAPSSLKTPESALSILAPGAQIDLKVLKTGDTPTFAVSVPATSTEQKVVELFKQLLPIQSSSAPLLNHLSQILPVLEHDATTAETLKRLAQEILASIPLKTHLTEPLRLKQSVDQSGLFLESKLAQLLSGKEGADLQQDLKLKLVKFVQLLTAEIDTQVHQKSEMDNMALLKEALQKTHAALAKLTLDQFQSIPKDDSAKLGWVLELPFFHDQKADTVQIEIEQDKQAGNGNHAKNWVVSITITPPELGTIHCRASCYDGSVNTRFWSDTADTVEKINAHLDYLKQQFEQKGLKTGFMEAHQGKPEATDSVKKPSVHLLSEKA